MIAASKTVTQKKPMVTMDKKSQPLSWTPPTMNNNKTRTMIQVTKTTTAPILQMSTEMSNEILRDCFVDRTDINYS